MTLPYIPASAPCKPNQTECCNAALKKPLLSASCKYLQAVFSTSTGGPITCDEFKNQKQENIDDIQSQFYCSKDAAEKVYNKARGCICAAAVLRKKIIIIVGSIMGGLLLLIIFIKVYQSS